MSIQLPIPSRLKYEFAWIHPKQKKGPLLDQFIRFQHLKQTSIGFTKGNFFSTFDIRDAFQTIQLNEESSLLKTMHTPWGHYQWTRLPFGVSSAPEEFQ